MNRIGSHSPPLAALIARASETDVLLTTGWELAHLPNTPPLGAGILYPELDPFGLRVPGRRLADHGRQGF